MKYTLEITIKLPRETVIEKIDSFENLKHWQKGFAGYEYLSGTPGEEGAKTKLHYKTGKRKVTLTETVISNDFPDAFHGTYEAKGVYNAQENYFSEVDENTTRWTSVSEFKFSGFPMKAMAFLMPGAFKKQSYTFMENFKKFAEEGISVAEAS